MMLKALYEAVNGKLDEREEEKNIQSKKRGTPLDESGLPEAASGVARQVGWMAKGHTRGDFGSEESEALDDGSVPEAAGGMARQADYMAKGMGIKD